MKVVVHTPRQLVVHDGVLSTALLGGTFLALGGGAIVLVVAHPDGWSGNAGPWFVWLLGSLFAVIGLAVLAMTADRRYVIDLDAKCVRMVAQRIGHRTVSIHALADLDDVALERSRGSSTASSFFRIVFLTKGGQRIAWTPYSTTAQASLGACAAEVRAFCGWARTHPLPPPSARLAIPVPLARGVHAASTSWGRLAVFVGLFAAIGLGLFAVEIYRVNTWQPADARVVSTDIKSVRGSKGSTSYAPVVVYEYDFEGRPYRADGVLPVSMSASVGWAEEIRDRFRPGDRVTAYVNPSEPGRAFLVREVSLLPLLFVVLPVGAVGLIAWLARRMRPLPVISDPPPVPIVEA